MRMTIALAAAALLGLLAGTAKAGDHCQRPTDAPVLLQAGGAYCGSANAVQVRTYAYAQPVLVARGFRGSAYGYGYQAQNFGFRGGRGGFGGGFRGNGNGGGGGFVRGVGDAAGGVIRAIGDVANSPAGLIFLGSRIAR